MSIASPHDLVLVRTLAGRIVTRVDSLLPSHVYSSRLGVNPPGWAFRDARKAHAEMRAEALALVEGGMLVSKLDVESYYPTLDTDILELNLVAWNCDRWAVETLCDILRHWNVSEGTRGIPIGPEGCAVLGNGYLLPMDIRLAALADVRVLRWMDDVLIFAHSLSSRVWAMTSADDELSFLGLRRSEEKSIHTMDIWEALELIHDSVLASLFEGLGRLPRKSSTELLRRRFHEEIAGVMNPEVRRFRGILKAMMFRKDSYAAAWLIQQPLEMNIDPAVAAEYLGATSLSDAKTTDAIFDLLRKQNSSADDFFSGLMLHLLRALTGRTWGRSEGKVFAEIAGNESLSGPIRAWAVWALRRTPVWKSGQVRELAVEETDVFMRRALVLSLRREARNPTLGAFHRHIRQHVPDLFTCSLWATKE